MSDKMDEPRCTTPYCESSSHFKRKILTVYSFLVCGLLITGLSVASLLQVDSIKVFVQDHFLITILSQTVLLTLNMSLLNFVSRSDQKGTQALFWALHCVLTAIPILDVDSNILMKTVMYTLVVTLVLFLKSFIIPENVIHTCLYPRSDIHSLILHVVFVCSVYGTVFKDWDDILSQIIKSIGLHGGFLVYSGLLMLNTQRLSMNAKISQIDCLRSAFVLYMNIMNIYSRVTILSADTPKVNVCDHPTDNGCDPPTEYVCE